MDVDVYLSVFTLMLISLGINILALKTKIPYTVLLVIAGSCLVPLSEMDTFSFVTSFHLTPELLFFLFLPVLIFESAYNIKIRNIQENKFIISLLAIVGLLISTFLIGYLGHWAFKLLGYDIPLLVTLLFGAIISATDPVAVLALFKEYGAPKRLTLIFEGESLFNDGTAFAIFLVLLEVMLHGYHGYSTVISGVISFFSMILSGIIFGLFMGFLFSKLIEWVKGHQDLEITLTLLVAHFTFLLAELMSGKWSIAGQEIHISSIIATLVASLVIGNHGRFKMSANVEEYMGKFWGYFAFLANSLVFILMGLLFARLTISLKVTLLPILVIITVVMLARAISIYVSVGIANQIKSEKNISMNWQHLLSWGSLRGAIAVIMVLLIPDDLTLPTWSYDFSIKEFITAITIGCIYFSLLIKATTIGSVIRLLKIDVLLPYEQLSYYKSKALIYHDLVTKIEGFYEHHQISQSQYNLFMRDYSARYEDACKQGQQQTIGATHVVENILRIYTLGIQKRELKRMFQCDEINENIYKKNLTILETQTERVEQDQPKLTSLNAYFNSGFSSLINRIKQRNRQPQELYLYYQTQYTLINKVLNEMAQLQNSPLVEIFGDPEAIENVILIYQGLKVKTIEQMKKEISSNRDFLDELNAQTAKAFLHTAQHGTLKDLYDHEIITNKLYVLLRKELND
ncbi:MAG: sodium:proton antiporter [Methylococcales bacterium]|nr:sodium:proton antiporter [Methylococcales bacterium]